MFACSHTSQKSVVGESCDMDQESHSRPGERWETEPALRDCSGGGVASHPQKMPSTGQHEVRHENWFILVVCEQ